MHGLVLFRMLTLPLTTQSDSLAGIRQQPLFLDSFNGLRALRIGGSFRGQNYSCATSQDSLFFISSCNEKRKKNPSRLSSEGLKGVSGIYQLTLVKIRRSLMQI